MAEEPSPIDVTHGSHEKAPDNGSYDASAGSDDRESAKPNSRKKRPWSSLDFKSVISTVPSAIEARRDSKDDLSVDTGHLTPKRPTAAPRGLSLQMPPRDISSTSTANLSKRISASPKPESSGPYASTGSVLPRRSRGMDFSRAATNLHHSTLAESSPESSPVVGCRASIFPRKSLFNPPVGLTMPESPISGAGPNPLWSAMHNSERPGLSSSVGSSNVMDYESGSSSSDDEAMLESENDDTIHTTPHTSVRSNAFNGVFGGLLVSSPGGDGVGEFTPAARKLRSFQRARAKSRKKRMSSSSASGRSSMHSPGPSSPPLVRSVESNSSINGYFLDGNARKEVLSRRESLSLGTSGMHLSDSDESNSDEKTRLSRSNDDVPIPAPVTPSMEERKSVIRRAVTRRTNMLPKTKGFARIRATLLEEGAPVDTEVKREAEVIRQVRESDAANNLDLLPSHPTTTSSSPIQTPATAGPADNLLPLNDGDSIDGEALVKHRPGGTFTNQAIRQSAGPAYWRYLDERLRTPPPQLTTRESSSAVSDDASIETPGSVLGSVTPQLNPSRSSVSQDSMTQTTFDIPRKGNKRMRDEDFDPNYFKRRAVSPGLSLQNSPVLPQSPMQRDGASWGWATPKNSREPPNASMPGERVPSNGSNGSMSAPVGTPKRIGLQGMTDTHDGLMNMSIE